MTQFGTTDSAAHLNHILPTPQTAAYLGRHPINPKASPDVTTKIYNPMFPTYWTKSSDNYASKTRDFHCSTYTYLGPEWFKSPPKHYETYKEPLRQVSTQVPSHRAQSVPPSKLGSQNDDYAAAFNEYPGRFKIEYAGPDDVNALCFRNNHVQYDSSVTNRQSRYAFQTDREPFYLANAMPLRIEPVTNPFRQSDILHAPTTTQRSWFPYGNTPIRVENSASQNPRF